MKSYGYVLILSLFFLKNSVFGLEADPSEAPSSSVRREVPREVFLKRMLLKTPSGERTVEEKVCDESDLREGHLLKAEWIRKVVGTENFYLVSPGIQIFSPDPQGQAERVLVWSQISPEMEKRKASVEALKSYLKKNKINVEDERSATKALFEAYCNGLDFIYEKKDSSKIQEAVAFLLKTQMLPTQKNIQAVLTLGLTLSSYKYKSPIKEQEENAQKLKEKILQWQKKNPFLDPMSSELVEIPKGLFSLLILDPRLSVHCPDPKQIKYVAPGYFYLPGSCEMRLVSLNDEASDAGLEASLRHSAFREEAQRELQSILYSSQVEVPRISNLAYLAFLNFRDPKKQRAIINLVLLGKDPDFGDNGNVRVVEELHALSTDGRYAEKLQRRHFPRDFLVTESLLNLWRTVSPEDQEAMVHLYCLGLESTVENINMLQRIRQGVGSQRKLAYEEISREFMDAFSSLGSDKIKQDSFLHLMGIEKRFWQRMGVFSLPGSDEIRQDSFLYLMGIKNRLHYWHWEREKHWCGSAELYHDILNSPYLEAIRKIRDNNGALEKTPFEHIIPAVIRAWVEYSSEAEKEAIVHVTYLNVDYEEVLMKNMIYSITRMRKGLKGAPSIPFHLITREVLLECSKHFMGASSPIICLVGLEKPLDELHLKVVKGLEYILRFLHFMKNSKYVEGCDGEVTNAMMTKILEDPSQFKILEDLRTLGTWDFSYLQRKLESRQDLRMFLESFKSENGL